MAKHVLAQVALLGVLVGAAQDWADVGLLLQMDPHVIKEVVPLFELFVTGVGGHEIAGE